MKRSTALLLITLLSTGVIVADTAAPESTVVGNAADLEKNAANPEASDEQSTDQSTVPETTPADDVELQPQEENAVLKTLKAAGSALYEGVAPKTPGEVRAMAFGFTAASVIAAVLHQRSMR